MAYKWQQMHCLGLVPTESIERDSPTVASPDQTCSMITRTQIGYPGSNPS